MFVDAGVGEGIQPSLPDAVAAVKGIPLLLKTMVFFHHFVGIGTLGFSPDLTTEVRVAEPHHQLHGLAGGVAKAQIPVVVEEAGSTAKRKKPSRIRESVKAVVMAFDQFERGVESHPMDQVGQLAESSADSHAHLALG